MNTFICGKKQKKFIITLLIIILFSFCYPKNVNAALGMDDLEALPLRIIWGLEKGVLSFLNNIFTSEENHTKTEMVNEKYDAEILTIYLTPENIIKGKFILLDADIFKEISNEKGYFDFGIDSVSQGKIKLREVISGWYYALRNFAIVALLSVLVYVGIRMIMSTVAQDKAKYKIMFKDWLVALCLLVVMHYMMIGILNLTSLITDAIGGRRSKC